MSGKGAAPFSSSWLQSTGEAPGRLIANLLLRGRPDELTNAELLAARADGIAAFKARNAAALPDYNATLASQQAAEIADPNIQAALADIRAEGGTEESLDALLVARSNNPTVAALDVQLAAMRAARKPGPAENDLMAVMAEMRFRGLRANGGG